MKYTDEVQAQAFANDLKVAGYYNAKVKKYGNFYFVDKGNYKESKESIENLELEKELKEIRKVQKQPNSSGSIAMKTLKGLKEGFSEMRNGALNPDKRSMKIGRTPSSRSNIPICQTAFKSKLAPGSAGIKKGDISYAKKNQELSLNLKK